MGYHFIQKNGFILAFCKEEYVYKMLKRLILGKRKNNIKKEGGKGKHNKSLLA